MISHLNACNAPLEAKNQENNTLLKPSIRLLQ